MKLTIRSKFAVVAGGVACLLFLGDVAGAQTPPLVHPEPLLRLARALQNLEAELTPERLSYCPDLNQDHAKRIGEMLGHMQDILARYRLELREGHVIARRHYDQVAASLLGQERKLARIQEIYAWQDFATNVGKLMLDMIDITAFGNDLLKTIIEKENPLAADSRIAQLRKLVAGLNDAAQAVEGIANQAPPAIRKKLDPPESPTRLDTVRQATQNLYSVANGTIDFLEGQKKLARGLMSPVELAKIKRGVKADVAQLTLGVFQSYAESLRAEMNQRARELEDIVPQEQAALAAAIRERNRWGRARQQVDDAIAALDKTRTLFDAVVSGYFDGRIGNRVDAQPKFPTAGAALRHLETVLPSKVDGLIAAIGGFRVKRPITPKLILAKPSFDPGESIEVKFHAPACLPGRAWVGLLPAGIQHGSALTNDQHDLGYRRMGKQAEGKLLFSAPNREGAYDLRMNSDSDGVEVTSVPFTVGRQISNQGNALMVPAGTMLQAQMGDIKSAAIRILHKSAAQ